MKVEFTQQLNSFFTQFENLMGRRKKLARQVQRLPNQQSQVYNNCVRHAQGRQVVFGDHCQQDDLSQRLAILNSQCSSVAELIVSAGDFSTDKLTKYLAGVLTRKTGVAWLPVRYLLRADACRLPRVDAYGLIKADAIKTLPGITDTMMLLDRKYGLPQLTSWVKFRETECEKLGCLIPDYETIENMDNIWMFTSNDFISVGANERFNAFFDLNGVEDKPFLHLYVTPNCEQPLREIGKIQGLNCYQNYDAPELSETHPHSIVLSALSELVYARVERASEREQVAEGESPSVPEAFFGE